MHSCFCVYAQSLQSCSALCNKLWTIAYQAPLSRGFARQEYLSGFPCPPPGDLSDPGIKLTSPVAPVLAGKFFSIEPQGKPIVASKYLQMFHPDFHQKPHNLSKNEKFRQPLKCVCIWRIFYFHISFTYFYMISFAIH